MTDQNQETVIYAQEDIDANKGMSILAYFLFFVPLITGGWKESPFLKFHTNQSIVLILLWVAVIVVSSITAFILIGFVIGPLGILFLTILYIMGIINAAQGQAKPLPLVGKIQILK